MYFLMIIFHSQPQLAYNITDLVDKNQRLNEEVDNTNKALDNNKKLESTCEATKQEKLKEAAMVEEWRKKFSLFEEQLKITENRLATITTFKDNHIMYVEGGNLELHGEVVKLKKDCNDQLLLGFQLIKEALKEVEPTFALERLKMILLVDLYVRVLAAVSVESPPQVEAKVQQALTSIVSSPPQEGPESSSIEAMAEVDRGAPEETLVQGETLAPKKKPSTTSPTDTPKA